MKQLDGKFSGGGLRYIFQCRACEIASTLELVHFRADARGKTAQLSKAKRFTLGQTSVLVFLLALTGQVHFYSYAQSQTPPAASSKATNQSPGQDIGWPRQISKEGATLVY